MEGNVQTKLNTSKCYGVHKKKHVIETPGKKQLLKVMGVLNITPDSFYDGGNYFAIEHAMKKAEDLIEDGADIIDIGAVSSRPYAACVSYEEEKKRLIPLLQRLGRISVPISIDTSDFRIAKEALDLGASYINDICGFESKELRSISRDYQAKICVMHMQGNPQTMQQNPIYPQGVMQELLEWFEKRIELLLKEGIQKENITIDPGIGFGKTMEDCLTIIKHLSLLKVFGCPILIGLSRKSFMSKILKQPATQLLSTTIALNTMSMREGAEIIRVHDVKEHRQVVDVLHAYFKHPNVENHSCII